MELKVGDVLLFKGKGIFAKLIYFANYIKYGKQGYSHIAIIGEIKKHSIIVYEAISEGFVKNEYGKNELDNLCYGNKINLYRSNYKLANVKKNCENLLGRDYAWEDIFSIALYIILGRHSFLINNNAKRVICSEAVALILYKSSNGKIDIGKEYNKKFSYITPYEISQSKYIKRLE